MIAFDSAPIPTPTQARQRDAERDIRGLLRGIRENRYEPDRLNLRSQLAAVCTREPLAAAAVLYQLSTANNSTDRNPTGESR